MIDSESPFGADKSNDPKPLRDIRTEEPQAPFGADEPNPNAASDQIAAEKAPGEPVEPGTGGYAGRDPASEMPRVPSTTQAGEDLLEGVPDSDEQPPASE